MSYQQHILLSEYSNCCSPVYISESCPSRCKRCFCSCFCPTLMTARNLYLIGHPLWWLAIIFACLPCVGAHYRGKIFEHIRVPSQGRVLNCLSHCFCKCLAVSQESRSVVVHSNSGRPHLRAIESVLMGQYYYGVENEGGNYQGKLKNQSDVVDRNRNNTNHKNNDLNNTKNKNNQENGSKNNKYRHDNQHIHKKSTNGNKQQCNNNNNENNHYNTTNNNNENNNNNHDLYTSSKIGPRESNPPSLSIYEDEQNYYNNAQTDQFPRQYGFTTDQTYNNGFTTQPGLKYPHSIVANSPLIRQQFYIQNSPKKFQNQTKNQTKNQADFYQVGSSDQFGHKVRSNIELSPRYGEDATSLDVDDGDNDNNNNNENRFKYQNNHKNTSDLNDDIESRNDLRLSGSLRVSGDAKLSNDFQMSNQTRLSNQSKKITSKSSLINSNNDNPRKNQSYNTLCGVDSNDTVAVDVYNHQETKITSYNDMTDNDENTQINHTTEPNRVFISNKESLATEPYGLPHYIPIINQQHFKRTNIIPLHSNNLNNTNIYNDNKEIDNSRYNSSDKYNNINQSNNPKNSNKNQKFENIGYNSNTYHTPSQTQLVSNHLALATPIVNITGNTVNNTPVNQYRHTHTHDSSGQLIERNHHVSNNVVLTPIHQSNMAPTNTLTNHRPNHQPVMTPIMQYNPSNRPYETVSIHPRYGIIAQPQQYQPYLQPYGVLSQQQQRLYGDLSQQQQQEQHGAVSQQQQQQQQQQQPSMLQSPPQSNQQLRSYLGHTQFNQQLNQFNSHRQGQVMNSYEDDEKNSFDPNTGDDYRSSIQPRAYMNRDGSRSRAGSLFGAAAQVKHMENNEKKIQDKKDGLVGGNCGNLNRLMIPDNNNDNNKDQKQELTGTKDQKKKFNDKKQSSQTNTIETKLPQSLLHNSKGTDLHMLSPDAPPIIYYDSEYEQLGADKMYFFSSCSSSTRSVFSDADSTPITPNVEFGDGRKVVGVEAKETKGYKGFDGGDDSSNQKDRNSNSNNDNNHHKANDLNGQNNTIRKNNDNNTNSVNDPSLSSDTSNNITNQTITNKYSDNNVRNDQYNAFWSDKNTDSYNNHSTTFKNQFITHDIPSRFRSHTRSSSMTVSIPSSAHSVDGDWDDSNTGEMNIGNTDQNIDNNNHNLTISTNYNGVFNASSRLNKGNPEVPDDDTNSTPYVKNHKKKSSHYNHNNTQPSSGQRFELYSSEYLPIQYDNIGVQQQETLFSPNKSHYEQAQQSLKQTNNYNHHTNSFVFGNKKLVDLDIPGETPPQQRSDEELDRKVLEHVIDINNLQFENFENEQELIYHVMMSRQNGKDKLRRNHVTGDSNDDVVGRDGKGDEDNDGNDTNSENGSSLYYLDNKSSITSPSQQQLHTPSNQSRMIRPMGSIGRSNGTVKQQQQQRNMILSPSQHQINQERQQQQQQLTGNVYRSNRHMGSAGSSHGSNGENNNNNNNNNNNTNNIGDETRPIPGLQYGLETPMGTYANPQQYYHYGMNTIQQQLQQQQQQQQLFRTMSQTPMYPDDAFDNLLSTPEQTYQFFDMFKNSIMYNANNDDNNNSNNNVMENSNGRLENSNDRLENNEVINDNVDNPASDTENSDITAIDDVDQTSGSGVIKSDELLQSSNSFGLSSIQENTVIEAGLSNIPDVTDSIDSENQITGTGVAIGDDFDVMNNPNNTHNRNTKVESSQHVNESIVETNNPVAEEKNGVGVNSKNHRNNRTQDKIKANSTKKKTKHNTTFKLDARSLSSPKTTVMIDSNQLSQTQMYKDVVGVGLLVDNKQGWGALQERFGSPRDATNQLLSNNNTSLPQSHSIVDTSEILPRVISLDLEQEPQKVQTTWINNKK